jgi:hypothetical protein
VTAFLRGLGHVLRNLSELYNRAKWAETGGVGGRVKEEMKEGLVDFRKGRT